MIKSLGRTIGRRPAVVGLVAGLVVVGGGVAGLAYAQSPTPSGSQPNFVQRLAQHLGLPEPQVTAALQAVRGEYLDEAVQNGRLTQQQADRIRQRPVGPGFGPGRFGAGHDGPGRGGPAGRFLKHEFAAIAQLLDLTPADLKRELMSGQSLVEVAEAKKGLDEATLIHWIVQDARAKMDQAVKDGELTRARADRLSERLPDRVKQLVETKPGAKRGFPGPGGPRGPRSNGA